MSFQLSEILMTGAAGMLAFPCPGCGSPEVERGNMFCARCREKLECFRGPYCSGCGGDLDTALAVCSRCLHADARNWDRAVALFPHRGLGRQLIHRFKYREQPELARAFGLLAAETLRERGICPQVIVPVPLHWSREWRRGFNQTALVCRVLGAEIGVPVRPLLRRSKRTPRQAQLTRDERRRNVNEAFAPADEKFCRSDDILVVDDVMTTGSTLNAAAAVLRRQGAERITVMALARR